MRLLLLLFFLLWPFLTTVISSFAASCSPGLIRAMREEGLSNRQIELICEKADLYDELTGETAKPSNTEFYEIALKDFQKRKQDYQWFGNRCRYADMPWARDITFFVGTKIIPNDDDMYPYKGIAYALYSLEKGGGPLKHNAKKIADSLYKKDLSDHLRPNDNKLDIMGVNFGQKTVEYMWGKRSETWK